MATICPYGGFTIGRPCTLAPNPPPPAGGVAPRPPAAAGGGGGGGGGGARRPGRGASGAAAARCGRGRRRRRRRGRRTRRPWSVGRFAFAAADDGAERLAGRAHHVIEIRELLRRRDQAERRDAGIARVREERVHLGIVR